MAFEDFDGLDDEQIERLVQMAADDVDGDDGDDEGRGATARAAASVLRHLTALAAAEPLGDAALLFEDERQRAAMDERRLAIVVARHRQAGAQTPDEIMEAMTETERYLAEEVLRRRSESEEAGPTD